MNLEKYNITWENRYDIISIELRKKIIDKLEEPFKKRGLEREKLINEHPRLIDENGNKTSKLIITSNKYLDGHIIYNGYDKQGVYSLFQPKNRIENEKWKYIRDKSEKLYKLYSLQIKLTETNINYSEIQNMKDEIDILFTDIFNINNKDDYPYPHLFKNKNIYLNFLEYSKRNIIDYYSDYSYLYQRLLNDKLIFHIKHLDFMKWLYDEKFISEKFYDEFIKKGSFKSFKKSSSAQRENNFNNIFL